MKVPEGSHIPGDPSQTCGSWVRFGSLNALVAHMTNVYCKGSTLLFKFLDFTLQRSNSQ